jgi:hypothetical protein
MLDKKTLVTWSLTNNDGDFPSKTKTDGDLIILVEASNYKF